MVLCQFFGALAGVALLPVLGIDEELGQVVVVVFFVFVIDNRVGIAIVIIFAASACCCCPCYLQRMMTTRQAVAAVAPAQRGSLWQDGSSNSSEGGCATCLRTVLDCDA
jgi:hypothetical protein